MTTPDEYFDVDAVARYLMMSPNTIRQYVSRGRIPFIKVPGSNLVRFLKSQVDEWMLQGLKCAGQSGRQAARQGGRNGKVTAAQR